MSTNFNLFYGSFGDAITSYNLSPVRRLRCCASHGLCRGDCVTKRQFYKTRSFSQVVLPFSQGEVSVQGYNMLLTLSSLYQSSDALLLSHNDRYQALSRRLLHHRAKDGVSFQEINRFVIVVAGKTRSKRAKY